MLGHSCTEGPESCAIDVVIGYHASYGDETDTEIIDITNTGKHGRTYYTDIRDDNHLGGANGTKAHK